MKIELKKVPNLNVEHEQEIYIDGNKIGCITVHNNDELWDADLRVYGDCIDSISNYKLSEFAVAGINYINIPYKFNFTHIIDLCSTNQTIVFFLDYEVPYLWLTIEVDLKNWQEPYSLKGLVEKCNSVSEKDFDISYDSNSDDNCFFISLYIQDQQLSINQIINNFSSNIYSILEKSIESLILEFKPNSLTSIFKFPPEIRTACEQYLIYFSKFLEDLGIEAKTSIENEAQNVLFTVTPQDPNQALSQIRDALNTYLSLPSENDLEKYSSNFKDISVQQLLSNVYHLKSQLILSQSIIQAKDATIQSLEFLNLQNKMIIDNKVDSETVIPKILSVEKYKGKGFTVDLPELFRLLKRPFK